MRRTVKPATGVTIEANAIPCAHACRYCSIGDKSAPVPLSRYLDLVDKFVAWSRRENARFDVRAGFFPSYNVDAPTFATLSAWHKRNFGAELPMLLLGGLPMKPEREMREWLESLAAVGLRRVMATFAGYGATHDRWNGRRGDFEHLVRALRIASAVGLEWADSHLVLKDTLPELAHTLSLLATLPTPSAHRDFRFPFHLGHGVHLEDQRIEEDDRCRLPPDVRANWSEELTLRSEREWLGVTEIEGESSVEPWLMLDVNPANIDELERLPCEDVLAKLEAKARASLAQLPTTHRLAQLVGDPTGKKIYTFMRDIDRAWLGRYLATRPLVLDTRLLHYYLGRSRRSPRLAEPAPVRAAS